MRKRIVCMIIGLSVLCSGTCNEIIYAQGIEPVVTITDGGETDVEETDVEETDTEETDFYELAIDELEECYEVGDVITINPILKRYYYEGEVQFEEIVGNDIVSYELLYDSNQLELIENEESIGYDLIRKSVEAIEIVVIASFTDSEGEIQSLEQTNMIEQLDYQIEFTNLREKTNTWMYVDETDYKLELVMDHLQDKRNAKIVWEVLTKTSGKKVVTGVTASEDGTALILNGEELNRSGYAGKTLVVNAKVFSGEIDTGVLATTDVIVRKTSAKLKSPIQGKYQLGKEWTYKTSVKAVLENGIYPDEETVTTNIEKIKSSNSKVVKVSYDKNDKIWTLKSLKTGSANITFYLSKGGREYIIEQKVTVICSHPITIETLQLEKIISQAKQWLGRKESDGSHKLIIDVYNSHKPLAINYKVQYYDAWCATYVSAVAIKTGYTSLIPTECGCERMINLFKQRGEWQENENCTPKQGWIIFYDWSDNGKGDNKGWSDHVGIVEKVSDGTITVIEGNYDDKVKRRKIKVNGRYIRGYAIPEYGKEITRATTTKNGKIEEGCTLCEEEKKTTIYAASKISLVASDYTYSGKIKSPEIIVKNSKGTKISKSEYTISGSTSKKDVGKYCITVTLNGKKYSGTKKLYYTINPKAPSKVSAVLNGGHDDVKVTWSQCSGADGYYVYYKKTGMSDYKKLVNTTKTSYSIKNLNDGKKYTFKIVPYFIQGGSKIESKNIKTASVYTLKKITVPVITRKSSTSVKVSWTDISGESGYQVSRSLRSGQRTIVSETTATSVTQKVTPQKSYYYSVRAYKKVNGKMIFGPWSEPVKYKLK